jgi:hypothetical protein
MNMVPWVAVALVVFCALALSGVAYWSTSLHRGNWAMVGFAGGFCIGAGLAVLWLLLAWLFGWGG